MLQGKGQAGALSQAEQLIAKWDAESGMTYRELAVALFGIFAEHSVKANDEAVKVPVQPGDAG